MQPLKSVEIEDQIFSSIVPVFDLFLVEEWIRLD